MGGVRAAANPWHVACYLMDHERPDRGPARPCTPAPAAQTGCTPSGHAKWRRRGRSLFERQRSAGFCAGARPSFHQAGPEGGFRQGGRRQGGRRTIAGVRQRCAACCDGSCTSTCRRACAAAALDPGQWGAGSTFDRRRARRWRRRRDDPGRHRSSRRGLGFDFSRGQSSRGHDLTRPSYCGHQHRSRGRDFGRRTSRTGHGLWRRYDGPGFCKRDPGGCRSRELAIERYCAGCDRRDRRRIPEICRGRRPRRRRVHDPGPIARRQGSRLGECARSQRRQCPRRLASTLCLRRHATAAGCQRRKRRSCRARGERPHESRAHRGLGRHR